MSTESVDPAAVAKYEQQLQAAFTAESERRDCSCNNEVNPLCKTHTEPSRRCSECRGWYTGQHFCWGSYPG